MTEAKSVQQILPEEGSIMRETYERDILPNMRRMGHEDDSPLSVASSIMFFLGAYLAMRMIGEHSGDDDAMVEEFHKLKEQQSRMNDLVHTGIN